MRGIRRCQDQAAPHTRVALGPRHVVVLEQLRGGPLPVGELACRLGVTLTTVSNILADLDRAGLIERYPDPRDRRRIFAQFAPGQEELIRQWLDSAASPIARVLAKLDSAEQEAFLKAMNLLETELSLQGTRR
jgi:DNA-binding MarR family transcriptional regulator